MIKIILYGNILYIIGFTYATQQGYADGFLESMDFHRDKAGNTIMCCTPDDPQWWITGFDSMTQDINPDELQ